MGIARKAKSWLRAGLQFYATPELKRRLWDSEFASGRWDCLDRTEGDCIYAFLSQYARKGHVLDLGCGSGTTAVELPAEAYATYTGIDISGVAIEKARHRLASEISERVRFFQSDFFTFEPDRPYDVILFRDSIYYVPPHRVPALIERLAPHLKPQGVFLVRLWGSHKNQTILDNLQESAEMVELYSHPDPVAHVAVLRPRR